MTTNRLLRRESWAGELYVSTAGWNGRLHRMQELIGSEFFDISGSKESIVVSCVNGSYLLKSSPSVEESDGNQSIIVSPYTENTNFTRLVCGDGFYVAANLEGKLYSWGIKGSEGQLGQGVAVRSLLQPTELRSSPNNVIDLSAGNAFTIALDQDGRAYSWGENFDSQLAIYRKSSETLTNRAPAMVEQLIFSPRLLPMTMQLPFAKIRCGNSFIIGLAQNGDVYSWGAGESGQLGTGRCTRKELPSTITELSGMTITDIACGSAHVLVVNDTGELYSWGLNQRGQCGLENPTAIHVPRKLTFPEEVKISTVYSHSHSSAAIDQDGKLWTWGSTASGRLLHTQPEHYRVGEETFVRGSVTTPMRAQTEETAHLRFHTMAFADGFLAAIVKTTLTHISTSRGPKRTFSQLDFHGYGLWDSDRILAKFTPLEESVYNPPRSSVGKLISPSIIRCKPPKFSETGIYKVELSMDGGEKFLPYSFTLEIYKEPTLSNQLPAVVNFKQKCIPKVEISLVGVLPNSLESTMGQDGVEVDVRLSFYTVSDSPQQSSRSAIPPTFNHEVKGIMKRIVVEVPPLADDEDSTVHSADYSNVDSHMRPDENRFLVTVEDLSLGNSLVSDGLFEVQALVSFNGQDFTGISSKEGPPPGTLCHSFAVDHVTPNCLSLSLLDELEIALRQNAENEASSLNPTLIDLHTFDRRVTIHGTSFFPPSKLPRGTHLKLVAISAEWTPIIDGVLAADSLHIDEENLSVIDDLLIACETLTHMSAIFSARFLKQVHTLISKAASQPSDSEITEGESTVVSPLPSGLLTIQTAIRLEDEQLSETPFQFHFLSATPIVLTPSFVSPSLEGTSFNVSANPLGEKGFRFHPYGASITVSTETTEDVEPLILLQAPATFEKQIITVLPHDRDDTAQLNEDVTTIEEENEGESSPAKPIERTVYNLVFTLPTATALREQLALDPNVSVPPLLVALAIDGVNSPPRENLPGVCYVEDPVAYTIVTPKGGNLPGTTVSLNLKEPLSSMAGLRVRVRGNVETAISPPINATYAAGVLSFEIPDAQIMADIPFVGKPKEKSFFVDISGDYGTSFINATTPMLIVKL